MQNKDFDDCDFDIEQVRQIFPITKTKKYLMNAALSPLNCNGRTAMEEYLQLSQTDLEARPDVRQDIKTLLSGLLGGNANDYALTTSTGHGISMTAAGLDTKPGQNIVLVAGEHWNSLFPWLNLERKGVEVRRVYPNSDNRVSLNEVENACDKDTLAVCVTAVRFDTGYRYDLKKLSKLIKQYDALFVVDGTQCAGANELNVIEDGIDVLAGAGFKWMLGMSGTGFLYTTEAARQIIHPVSPGMYAAHHDFDNLQFHADARKYETGTIGNLVFVGWVKGLELLTSVGLPAIVKRNQLLTKRLISGLSDLKIEIVSPHDTEQERSAILAIKKDEHRINQEFCDRLRSNDVLVSDRGKTVRISPNFFNTEAEIDALLALV